MSRAAFYGIIVSVSGANVSNLLASHQIWNSKRARARAIRRGACRSWCVIIDWQWKYYLVDRHILVFQALAMVVKRNSWLHRPPTRSRTRTRTRTLITRERVRFPLRIIWPSSSGESWRRLRAIARPLINMQMMHLSWRVINLSLSPLAEHYCPSVRVRV